ncbi:hypothetical protein T484DRAFT_1821647 [Baffinella frigidus]|nr:hypothetical protein T484DRAFT_1821647 [Cryptophyta sp. CCMP2293]
MARLGTEKRPTERRRRQTCLRARLGTYKIPRAHLGTSRARLGTRPSERRRQTTESTRGQEEQEQKGSSVSQARLGTEKIPRAHLGTKMVPQARLGTDEIPRAHLGTSRARLGTRPMERGRTTERTWGQEEQEGSLGGQQGGSVKARTKNTTNTKLVTPPGEKDTTTVGKEDVRLCTSLQTDTTLVSKSEKDTMLGTSLGEKNTTLVTSPGEEAAEVLGGVGVKG